MKRNFFLPALLLAVLFCSTAFRFALPDEPLSASVTAERMNVFYRGLDNPVSIKAGGLSPDQLIVTAEGAAISGGNGRYTVSAIEGNTVTIRVSYNKDGKPQQLATTQFRVKKIPNPVCYVADVRDIGFVSKEKLTGTLGIFARMVDFDFDMTYKLASFDLAKYEHADSAYVTKSAAGPAFTPEMRAMLQKAKTGDRFFIENVMVTEPAGAQRKIPGVTLIVR